MRALLKATCAVECVHTTRTARGCILNNVVPHAFGGWLFFDILILFAPLSHDPIRLFQIEEEDLKDLKLKLEDVSELNTTVNGGDVGRTIVWKWWSLELRSPSTRTGGAPTTVEDQNTGTVAEGKVGVTPRWRSTCMCRFASPLRLYRCRQNCSWRRLKRLCRYGGRLRGEDLQLAVSLAHGRPRHVQVPAHDEA